MKADALFGSCSVEVSFKKFRSKNRAEKHQVEKKQLYVPAMTSRTARLLSGPLRRVS
jgi:hypothetical protein